MAISISFVKSNFNVLYIFGCYIYGAVSQNFNILSHSGDDYVNLSGDVSESTES